MKVSLHRNNYIAIYKRRDDVYINKVMEVLAMTWENVTGAVTNLLDVMSTVVTTIVGNPYLAVFLAVPVVGAGIAIFRKFKRS